VLRARRAGRIMQRYGLHCLATSPVWRMKEVLFMRFHGLLPCLTLFGTLALGAEEPLAWRGVWEWSMDHRSQAGLTAIADSCHRLGFNALMMLPPSDQVEFMAGQCHRRGVKLYLSTVFTGGEPGWQQVMTPAERDRAAQKPPDTHQQGGEPLTPEEVFTTPLPCWNRPEVREYFTRRVTELARLPADGLAFDMVGYQNYRRCQCPVCEAKLAEYRRQHPEQGEQEAAAAWAELTLVDFINDMARIARAARTGIELTIHVYPYFRPEPYYGNRLEVDTVGQTVSWFFEPHWPLEKVRRLTEDIVGRQHAYYPQPYAAPFLGFYSTPAPHARSAERVRAELQIVRASGAHALQMAELGHLVRAPAVAAAVTQVLAPQ